ncbi:hypothetical protein SNE40_015117 [Patella caerulea]|uniref:Uncharacterized protein n=1 Tax=Patella caerulea TaxID=87958 RepID=A0AAN8PE50_PATCE
MKLLIFFSTLIAISLATYPNDFSDCVRGLPGPPGPPGQNRIPGSGSCIYIGPNGECYRPAPVGVISREECKERFGIGQYQKWVEKQRWQDYIEAHARLHNDNRGHFPGPRGPSA